ncbi:hypothetical protein CsSME_00037564 [Camellia sinensis var. sinensis]
MSGPLLISCLDEGKLWRNIIERRLRWQKQFQGS